MAVKVSVAWLLAAGVCLTSCGGSTTSQYIDPASDAPRGLDYPDPNVFTQGVPITALVPKVGGKPTTYLVAPDLPPGLVLNGSTGVISGTPTEARAETSYDVMALNPLGTSQFGVRITVNGRYKVGGVVIGLTGTGLVLANNGEDLPISETGAFIFTRGYSPGTGYIVTVATQPSGQTCGISAGVGILNNVDYRETIVTCSANASANANKAARAGKMPPITCLYPPSPESIRGLVMEPDTGSVTPLGELLYVLDPVPDTPLPTGCANNPVMMDSLKRWVYVIQPETHSIHVYSTIQLPGPTR